MECETPIGRSKEPKQGSKGREFIYIGIWIQAKSILYFNRGVIHEGSVTLLETMSIF